MRFTRAAPARPTSSRTRPTYRCVAPFTAATRASPAGARLTFDFLTTDLSGRALLSVPCGLVSRGISLQHPKNLRSLRI